MMAIWFITSLKVIPTNLALYRFGGSTITGGNKQKRRAVSVLPMQERLTKFGDMC